MKKIVILISGRGSNMQALLKANVANARIVAVISNKADAAGLKIAENFGIETAVISQKDFKNRSDFDCALAKKIECFSPDLIVLAGFMRILGKDFVARFEGRLMNIHPSLLPSFTGLNTHERAIEAGVKIHGCTVHFVTPELDCGPIIIQAAVPVLDSDSPDALAARVLKEEHRILPQAVKWFVENRLKINGLRVEITHNSAEKTPGNVFPR